jgi:hypothetical protein
MVNIELSKNRTLQSRMGFTKVLSDISAAVNIKSVYKTAWDDYTESLYYTRSFSIMKINETAGTESNIALIPITRPVQFQRWKDKLIVLSPGMPLYWMDSSEVLRLVAYPQFKVSDAWAGSIAPSAGGELSETTIY